MSEKTHPKSKLELQAEKFLEHDSLLSDSDDSLERAQSSYSTKKIIKKSKKHDDSQSTKSSARKLHSKRSSKANVTVNLNEQTPRSKSRPRKEKSISSLRSPRAVDAPAHISSLKDNYSLRIKINDLSKTLNKKNKQIKTLYDKVYAEKEEIRELTHKTHDLTKKNSLLDDYQEKIHALQENEINLIKELSDQQKIAKDALTRLYELQEQSVKDIDDSKRYYRDFYGQQTNEIKQQLEDKVTLITKEKDNLISTIKNIEAVKDSERNTQINLLNHEIINLKEKLITNESEAEKLKNENKELRRKLREQEDSSNSEKVALKDKIEELIHQNQIQRTHEEEHSIKDANEKTKLHRKIENLEKEVAEKEKTIKAKDKEYREQLELINSKVQSLQKELRKVSEYEIKIESLQKELSTKEKELDLAKQYYKDKLSTRKKSQNDQKNEWSSIYGELITEIKSLKTEIDSLGTENKKLLTNFHSKTIVEY